MIKAFAEDMLMFVRILLVICSVAMTWEVLLLISSLLLTTFESIDWSILPNGLA